MVDWWRCSFCHSHCLLRQINCQRCRLWGKDICCPIEIQTTICCLVLLSVTLAPRWVDMVSITVGFNSLKLEFQDFSCYKDGVKLTVKVTSLYHLWNNCLISLLEGRVGMATDSYRMVLDTLPLP